MFDPTVGRWLAEDPKGFDAGDPNLFRYVKNNPTNATDPSGAEVYKNQQSLPKKKIVWMDQQIAPSEAKILRYERIKDNLVRKFDKISQHEYDKFIEKLRQTRLEGKKWNSEIDPKEQTYMDEGYLLSSLRSIQQPYFQLMEYLQRIAKTKTSSVTVQVRYIDGLFTASQFADWVSEYAEPGSINLYSGHGASDSPTVVNPIEKKAVLEALEKVAKKPGLVDNLPKVTFFSCHAGEFNLNMPQKLGIPGAMETKLEISGSLFIEAAGPASLNILTRVKSADANKQPLTVNLFFGDFSEEYRTRTVAGKTEEFRNDNIDNPHFLDWNFQITDPRKAKYYAVGTEKWGQFEAKSKDAGTRELFELVPVEGNKVALLYSTGYLRAESGGGDTAAADAFAIGPWEKWTRVNNTDGTVSLQSSTGKYLLASGGTFGLRTRVEATGDKPEGEAKFTLVSQGALHALKATNGRFISTQD